MGESAGGEPAGSDHRTAQRFWRGVIAEYTRGVYTEEQLATDEWHGPRQRFQSRAAEE